MMLNKFRSFHEKIKEMVKNTIFNMFSEIYPFPLTMEREGRSDEMLEYFKNIKNVEKFVEKLQNRVGNDVKIKLTGHRNNMFDITVDHTYHFDLTDIGFVENE